MDSMFTPFVLVIPLPGIPPVPSLIPPAPPAAPIIPLVPSPPPVPTGAAPPASNTQVQSSAPSTPVLSTVAAAPVISTAIPTTTSAITTPLNTIQPAVLSSHVSIVPSGTGSMTLVAHSSTPTSNSSSRSNSGPVAGGVVVGLIALGAFAFAVALFLRRSRKERDGHFDASEFRRSAVLMHDPPTHEDTVAHGFNPRPPTMIERRLASPAPTFGNQYDVAPLPNQYDVGNGYNPGPITYNNQAASFAPFHGQGPNPIVGYDGSQYYQADDQMQYQNVPYELRQQLNTAPSMSPTSRPASGNAPGAANGFTFPPRWPLSENSTLAEPQSVPIDRELAPADDYVDLSRSSVSPFQAMQYAEITKKLNSAPTSPIIPDMKAAASQSPPVPPKGMVSPFNDPPTYQGNDLAGPVGARNMEESIRESYSSAQSTLRGMTPEPQDFPVPPSPAQTISSRYRADSSPPTLPELQINSSESDSFGTFSASRRGSAERTSQSTKFQAAIPSPLAASYIPSQQSVDKTSSQVEQVKTGNNAVPKVDDARTRPETMYDPEDVYGGI
ncbi:hypothetical protein AX17_007538 [Amanita inopinata Kibby_2008]|nr:hypothetical protein AX17_007538 [Amanita inopinata Kibby_2008]